MVEFKNIDEIKIGNFVIDSYNEFTKKEFKFINGQKFDVSLALCEVVDKTNSSICIRINKHPLRIMKKDGGGISNPISNLQWFKFKREHEYEIGFCFRFFKNIV